MKKLLLIGPDGNKTYIDLGEDFSFNEDSIKKYMRLFFEHFSEDNLEVMFVDAADTGAGQAGEPHVLVPNIKRFLEMLEFRQATMQYLEEEELQMILDNVSSSVIN